MIIDTKIGQRQHDQCYYVSGIILCFKNAVPRLITKSRILAFIFSLLYNIHTASMLWLIRCFTKTATESLKIMKRE